MISDSAFSGWRPAGWEAMAALLAAEGSAAHPHVVMLLAPRASQRDLADAVHAICAVHGRASERLHEAAALPTSAAQRDRLVAMADSFAVERGYLAAIVSAAGPLPSTPGQAQTEQALATARHAFHMLAISDRHGCMIGAAAALALDWETIRALLDRAAARFGVETTRSTLLDDIAVAAMLADAADTRAAERAIAFGAQQVLAQHRGLWDLLDARASARHGLG